MTVIRPARMEDIPGLAEAKIAAWRQAYAHILPPDYLAAMSLEKERPRWEARIQEGQTLLAAEVSGRVVGFALTHPESRPHWTYPAMLAALYLHPDAQNRGLGRQLIRETAALAQSWSEGLMVSVFTENPRARSLYVRLGARFIQDEVFQIEGVGYPDQLFAWDDLDDLMGRCGSQSGP